MDVAIFLGRAALWHYGAIASKSGHTACSSVPPLPMPSRTGLHHHLGGHRGHGSCLARWARAWRAPSAAFAWSPPRAEDACLREGRELDCGESGSTLRFSCPWWPHSAAKPDLTGHGQLAARPLSPPLRGDRLAGATLSAQGRLPPAGGRQHAGGVPSSFPGNVSSQFVSGLLMAGAVAGLRLDVSVTEPIQSRPYIGLTTRRPRPLASRRHLLSSRDGEGQAPLARLRRLGPRLARYRRGGGRLVQRVGMARCGSAQHIGRRGNRP